MFSVTLPEVSGVIVAACHAPRVRFPRMPITLDVAARRPMGVEVFWPSEKPLLGSLRVNCSGKTSVEKMIHTSR